MSYERDLKKKFCSYCGAPVTPGDELCVSCCGEELVRIIRDGESAKEGQP
jgi:predicted nucleic acid-binding Zn ribbon protein